jgi:magnesium chelatase subunit D
MLASHLVGLEAALEATLLLAVDPGLGGLGISGSVGSGKSSLARTLANAIPEGAPFVELPLGITQDRVLGGLDFETMLTTGRRVVESGVLARADGGVLYVDALNRLDQAIVTQLLDVMSRGSVAIEREGLSLLQPARFMLVASFDPSDGEPPRDVLDRLALIVSLPAQRDPEGRADVVRVVTARDRAVASAKDDADEIALWRDNVARARERLGSVTIEDEQLLELSLAALSLGVEGNRADIFAARAAIAAAALAGRTVVSDDDVALACKLVLLPRATQMPKPPEPEQKEQPPEEKAAQPEAEPDPDPDEQEDDEDETEESEPAESAAELLVGSVAVILPPNLLEMPFAKAARGGPGSRGETQKAKRGRVVGARPGSPKTGSLALFPTLIAAAPRQKMRAAGGRFAVERDDFRIKRFRSKAGTLFLFVVDASGSMAVNRMREAKGAVTTLLQQAYVHRDHIGLISFRGREAQVLLPPTQSVERAKRELDVLPTGGATPLAAALVSAWQTARQARARGLQQCVLVLMTDGRGNVPLTPRPDGARASEAEIDDEVRRVCALIRADGCRAVVVDTQVDYLSRGYAPRLADYLDARYLYLPNANAADIVRHL